MVVVGDGGTGGRGKGEGAGVAVNTDGRHALSPSEEDYEV